jgi:hypothetical protein
LSKDNSFSIQVFDRLIFSISKIDPNSDLILSLVPDLIKLKESEKQTLELLDVKIFD